MGDYGEQLILELWPAMGEGACARVQNDVVLIFKGSLCVWRTAHKRAARSCAQWCWVVILATWEARPALGKPSLNLKKKNVLGV